MRTWTWTIVLALAACEGVDRRSPYDLAAAIESSRRDPSPEAGKRLNEDWSGRRYRWSVRFVPALCARPDACRVLPFDHERSDRVTQGWLPSLELTPAQHSVLRERCRPIERCVVEVEGAATVSVDDGGPPAVTFAQVRVGRARQAHADESWVRRRSTLRSGL